MIYARSVDELGRSISCDAITLVNVAKDIIKWLDPLRYGLVQVGATGARAIFAEVAKS